MDSVVVVVVLSVVVEEVESVELVVVLSVVVEEIDSVVACSGTISSSGGS